MPNLILTSDEVLQITKFWLQVSTTVNELVVGTETALPDYPALEWLTKKVEQLEASAAAVEPLINTMEKLQLVYAENGC